MGQILLVDDDTDIIEQNKAVLQNLGHSVQVAYSGESGLQWLEKNEPDLLILDVMMETPRAGLTLARKTHQLYSNLPVVILSSDYQRAEWCNESFETWENVVKFLYKPISSDNLAHVVETIFREKRRGLLENTVC